MVPFGYRADKNTKHNYHGTATFVWLSARMTRRWDGSRLIVNGFLWYATPDVFVAVQRSGRACGGRCE